MPRESTSGLGRELNDDKSHGIGSSVEKCRFPPRRDPDYVTRRFAYSIVLTGFQVDVGNRNQQLRTRLFRRRKRVAGQQLYSAHGGRSQQQRIHELGVGINRRSDGDGTVVPLAGITLITVV